MNLLVLYCASLIRLLRSHPLPHVWERAIKKYIILILISTCAYAHNIEDKIKSFSEKISIEQEQFPNGDYKNITYVQDIIKKMYLLDQEVRTTFLTKDLENPLVQNIMSSMDKFHTIKMKEILTQHNGWITISKFGEEADKQAWLLVQHADHDPFFQAGCAFILANLQEKGETSKQNYAYLYDRAAIGFEMKQRYGTQFIIIDDKIELAPYEGSIAELNQRRKSMGLNTIEQHFEILKKIYSLNP